MIDRCSEEAAVKCSRNYIPVELVGTSQSHLKVISLIDKVKNIDTPVFIWGESGTGKELVARIIHDQGKRQKGKFVVINCGAVPDHLLESELFGYCRGAFTGAVKNKPGLLEEADGGTFFLDEIADLSLPLQAKLLRVIQEKEIRRLGENWMRRVDVRFISATNKVLENEVAKGCFREDLFYRLKIIPIELTPLRSRKSDIIVFLDYFLEKYCMELKRPKTVFSPEAMEMLISHRWPGNVRELQNEVQRCLILCKKSNVIGKEYLSFSSDKGSEEKSVVSYNFSQAKADFEKRFIRQALVLFDYNRLKTAQNIGLSRQGLFKLIKKHKIDIPKKRKQPSSQPG
ncbi:MAG: sigma-54-dependent Fis family transcriptional regulator [Candidatus Aminicenantes bacterium]|nr:sigma-54-dependent Fis family transcriptional regulator [Candidatus Aminicenantes bacterium]